MKAISNILIYFGIILLISITFFLVFKLPIPINYSQTIKSDVWGHYGDVVGGVIGTIFSIVGVFLLIGTLKGTEKAEIEKRIFELIKFHRENINEITTNYKGGRLLFKKITEEINLLYEQVSQCETKMIQEKKIEIDEKTDDFQKMQVAYLIAFFGFDIDSNETLKEKVCSFTQCNDLMKNTLACIPSFKDKFNSKLGDNHYNIYSGYQFVLGHYFRHLYQSVTYINKIKELSYKDKYYYTKTLRAHLSTYEQILFFYNSLSSLGHVWEISISDKEQSKWSNFLSRITPYLKYKIDKENYNNKLITKYNLIKNIPMGITPVDPQSIYPEVQYEGDCISEKKLLIKKYYR